MSLIRIGSRGSDLALWQANYVKSELEQLGHQIEITIIKTQGDRIQHLSFDKLEGKGFFTKEIEDALLSGEIDLAVHSHKDLETNPPEGLVVACVSSRANPCDLLLMRKEAKDSSAKWELKNGAVVGTSSARRKSQFFHHRPDCTLKDLRGNVPTRIDKLRQGEYDAILLARAGVDRLKIDLSEFSAFDLDPTEFVPAPAQGVLGLQIREKDHELAEILSQLNNEDVAGRIEIERKILNQLEGGCQLPLGAYCDEEDKIWIAFGNKTLDHCTYIQKYRTNDKDFIPSIVTELNMIYA
jgi:hydroxymethylbilane synthase